MTNYLLDGLKAKRAELTGEIARCQARLQQIAIDLEHIDGALRVIAPDFVAESVLPKIFTPPSTWSKRGEMSRAVLGILRVARNPMSTREIAAQLVVQRGLAADTAVMNIMTRRVAGCLKDKRERGVVRSIEQTGLWLQWEIVRD